MPVFSLAPGTVTLNPFGAKDIPSFFLFSTKCLCVPLCLWVYSTDVCHRGSLRTPCSLSTPISYVKHIPTPCFKTAVTHTPTFQKIRSFCISPVYISAGFPGNLELRLETTLDRDSGHRFIVWDLQSCHPCPFISSWLLYLQ